MIRDILDVATPSMRPPWSGRSRPLTRDETILLVLASRADGGRLRYRDVCDVLPGEPWHVLNSLKKQGALNHPGYDRWEITEKGRIAAALALGKDPQLAEVFND